MPKYFSEVDFEEEFPTVKELAARIAKDYGVVTYRGTPHCDFVRAVLELDIIKNHKPALMTIILPHTYVYQNADVLLDFVEAMLPKLEKHKALLISFKGIKGKFGKDVKQMRIFWKDSLPKIRRKTVDISRMLRFNYDGNLNRAA